MPTAEEPQPDLISWQTLGRGGLAPCLLQVSLGPWSEPLQPVRHPPVRPGWAAGPKLGEWVADRKMLLTPPTCKKGLHGKAASFLKVNNGVS